MSKTAQTPFINSPAPNLKRYREIVSVLARHGFGSFLILSDFPSLYVLLDDCQGIVGHRRQELDTNAHLSRIFFYATCVPKGL